MKRLGRGTAACLVAAIASFFVTLGVPAFAHGPGNFYFSGWPQDHDEYYFFRTDVPGGNFRDRVIDGEAEWNDTPNDGNAEPNFYSAAPDKSGAGGDWNQPCNANYSAVYYRDLDSLGSTVLGYTPSCKVLVPDGPNSWYKITKFSLNLDNDRDWYTGTGDAPDHPADPDVWSLASHELGHATGWEGHFTGSTLCPGDSTEQTMCQIYENGSERWRTLAEHDTHTFENHYPYP